MLHHTGISAALREFPLHTVLDDTSLHKHLADSAPTAVDNNLTQACVRELDKICGLLGEGWRVEPFGSVVNGFGTRGSDLDVTCFNEDLPSDDESCEREELMSRLLPLLLEHPQFDVLERVVGARIPILKLRFAETLDVDLSCHNIEPLPNTWLLRAYADMHPYVRDLVVAVKLWAKAKGVCDAKNGHLSSYSLTLMALYFLQVDPEFKLPPLCTSSFSEPNPAIPHLKWQPTCGLTRILSKFFQFYAVDFDWGAEVVSVRLAHRLSRMHEGFSPLNGRWISRLHVEDPFLLARNLNCALGRAQERALSAAIEEAAQSLQGGQLPVGLRPASDDAEVAGQSRSSLSRNVGGQKGSALREQEGERKVINTRFVPGRKEGLPHEEEDCQQQSRSSSSSGAMRPADDHVPPMPRLGFIGGPANPGGSALMAQPSSFAAAAEPCRSPEAPPLPQSWFRPAAGHPAPLAQSMSLSPVKLTDDLLVGETSSSASTGNDMCSSGGSTGSSSDHRSNGAVTPEMEQAADSRHRRQRLVPFTPL